MANKKLSLEEQRAQFKSNKAELKELYALESNINEQQFERIELLEKENKLLKTRIAGIQKSSKAIQDQNDFLKDTEELTASIADKVGKNNNLYKTATKYIESTKTQLQNISSIVQNTGDLKLSRGADKATAAFREYQKEMVSIAEQAKDSEGNQEQIALAAGRAREQFVKSITHLQKMGEEGQQIYDMLMGMSDEATEFSDAVSKTNKSFDALNTIMDQFSGVPLMKEFTEVIDAAKNKSAMLKGAIVALGTAVGALAGSYFGAEFDAGLKITNDITQTQIDGERERLKLSNERNFIDSKIGMEVMQSRIDNQNELNRLDIEKNFASQRAANQFAAQMKSSTAQFIAASKTALFGDKLGGVGYGAAQLQLAGIGAEKIAEQMTTAGDVMGSMPSSKIASDMAVISTRTGASSDAIAQLAYSFMRTDGVSTQVALNLQEGMRAMATAANIPLNTLMQEVADASKEMIGYQIRSTTNLAKQVAFTKSMGVNFNDIAKAGKSMVLNYKDSIKAEMQLSAILGKSVDLSEVRSKFASGDVTGALESLKAQGLNPEDMDMFQQEALSQALGGMDLATLRNIATRTGKNVGLTQANAAAGNQSFLSRTQAAQSALATQEAMISAEQAIIDAKLSQKITEAYLTSTGYKTYQDALIQQQIRQSAIDQAVSQTFQKLPEYANLMAQETRLAIERNFTEGWAKMLGGAIGAIAGMALTNKISGGDGGGLTDILKKMLPGSGTGRAGGGMMQTAGRFASKAGPVAAAAAGFISIFQGIKNVATSDALTAGSGLQDFGNTVANVGASFVNILDQATFGLTKMAAESAGVSIKGVRTDLMENARGAYRAKTGQQIGVGAESNQKLIDWVMENKDYLKGAGGLPGTVKAFEEAVTSGKIKISAPIKPTTTDANLKSSQVSANTISDKNAALGMQSALSLSNNLKSSQVSANNISDKNTALFIQSAASLSNNLKSSQVSANTISDKNAALGMQSALSLSNNLKSSQVSANTISDKNAAFGIQSAANIAAQLNVNKEQVSELGTMVSILTSIKNNDDIRGKLMYGQDKLQTGYLAKSFTRHHTSMQVLETQLTIMKQTRDLQEIAVEFLAELLKKQEVSPKISLDGKVLNSKLFDRGQRDRIIA